MNSEPASTDTSAVFPRTIWAMIQIVQDRGHPEYRQTLENFARIYWKPVYCFLRARGCRTEEAEELAQEFFLRLLHGNWVQKADQERGQFRVFMRMHLRSFLADQKSPLRLPRQRLFEGRVQSLNGLAGDKYNAYEPTEGDTPDKAFDRAFAVAVVETVRQKLRSACVAEKRPEWYDIFAATFPDDCLTTPQSQQALAQQFGKSRDQVRTILTRMKEFFLHLLRNELRAHGGNERDIEEERVELLNLLSPAHRGL